jgi:hypothetical protein
MFRDMVCCLSTFYPLELQVLKICMTRDTRVGARIKHEYDSDQTIKPKQVGIPQF